MRLHEGEKPSSQKVSPNVNHGILESVFGSRVDLSPMAIQNQILKASRGNTPNLSSFGRAANNQPDANQKKYNEILDIIQSQKDAKSGKFYMNSLPSSKKESKKSRRKEKEKHETQYHMQQFMPHQ